MKITKKQALIGLVIIVLVGGFLRFWKLDQQSFIADEYLGVNIAEGYNRTGEWRYWDFNEEKPTDEIYTRANMYYWQVAQTAKYYGLNEAGGRMVSVVWGIIGLILVFFIAFSLYRNWAISFASAALLAVSISALIFDRKLRMYSMFAPVYFLLSYLIFRFLESAPEGKWVPSSIKKVSEKIGLNPVYVIPGLIVGLISLNTHLLTANIFITILAYLLAMAVYSFGQDKKYISKYSVLLILAILGFFAVIQFKAMRDALSFFSWNVGNWSYLEKVLLDYSYGPLGAFFLLLGAWYLIKKYGRSGFWMLLSFLVPLFLAIMSWQRNAGHQYIYFSEPFKVVLVGAGIWYFATTLAEKIFPQRAVKYFWIILGLTFLLTVNLPFFFSAESFYEKPTKWSYPNYREVYDYYLKHRKADDLLITRKLTYYYIAGSYSNVLNYGADDKITLDDLKSAEQKYPRIWFIASSDTYIKGDAMKYIETNFKLVETKYTNDTTQIWLWDRK